MQNIAHMEYISQLYLSNEINNVIVYWQTTQTTHGAGDNEQEGQIKSVCERERERAKSLLLPVRTNDNNVVMQNEQQFVYIASAKLMHVTFSLR